MILYKNFLPLSHLPSRFDSSPSQRSKQHSPFGAQLDQLDLADHQQYVLDPLVYAM